MALRCLAVLVFGLAATSLAHAASQRTFVSTSGINNSTCSIAAPCRDFASAIAATSANGEIIVLDSGGYGSVTIAQSVSIIAPPGVYAGISVFTGDGITVAAAFGDKVTLRGLTINGQGGSTGIIVSSGGEVHIEQCIVTNMASDGIRIDGGFHVYLSRSLVRSNGQHGLNVAQGTPVVRAIDSQFSNNGSIGIAVGAGTLDAERITADQNGSNGVRVQPLTGLTATATLSDSATTGNGLTGVAAAANIAGRTTRLAVNRSISARNGGGGFGANSFDVGTTFFTVSDSTAVENSGNGVIVSGTNTVGIVTGSTVARNTGFDFDQRNASVFLSSGNNTLTGRGAADITGTITPNPLK